MFVVSGKRCNIALIRTDGGPIFSTRLVALAKNGSVSVSGNRIFYVSRPGYAGDDHFVYARQGMDMINRPVTRTVDISVRVAAH